jgi:hypothetical protein
VQASKSAPAAPQLQRNAATPWVQEGPAKPAFAWKTLSDLIGAEKAQLMHTFVTPEVNTFEASNAQLLQRLKSKWDAAAQGRLTVLHFGDSHVQGGHAAQMARHKWQSMLGSSGRGMVFPYAIAKTYSQNDYRSTFEGDWVTANSIQVYPKMPLGVSGFVARTSSPQAAFTLQFNQQFERQGAEVFLPGLLSGLPTAHANRRHAVGECFARRRGLAGWNTDGRDRGAAIARHLPFRGYQHRCQTRRHI